jgi:glyoxylase I family protein
VGFNAALVFGLAQLLLADHDGRVDRRDYLAIACGVLGLMCGGLAVTMVFIVGVVMFLRRGWRVALLQVGPPAAIFAVWWTWIGRDAYRSTPKASVSQTLQWAWRGIATAFSNVGATSGTAALLLLVLAAGLALAWRQAGSRDSRLRTLAVPGAMLVGVLVLLALAGYGRANWVGIDSAERSRYGHLVLALSTPAIAVAVNALTTLRHAAGLVIAALLVAGIPTNLQTVANTRFGERAVIMAMAHEPLVRQVPARDRPDPIGQPLLTVGWLADNAGRIPNPHPSPTTAADATIRLSLEQHAFPTGTAAPCIPLSSKPVERRLAKGQQLQSKGGRLQIALAVNGRSVGQVVYGPEAGNSIALTAEAPVDLRVAPATRAPTMLCTGGASSNRKARNKGQRGPHFRRAVIRLNGSMAIDLNEHALNAGEAFDPTRTGLDHLGFSVASYDALIAWVAYLDAKGVAHSPMRNLEGVGEGFDLRDPDGIQIELWHRDQGGWWARHVKQKVDQSRSRT